MILLFPNYDTLRLALISSIVPTEITLAPASVTFDDQGKIYLESSATLQRSVTRNLDKIGVKGSKRHATIASEEISSWLQILPLTKDLGTPNVSNQAAVLFELTNGDDLAILVAEMLRLGNDRQSFRWFADPADPDSHRVLLRVVGPPYYTLLRAIDPSAAGTKGSVRAYLESSPRVWVELGYRHPLAAQIRVDEKQFLLIHSPRNWVYLEEAAFQDVYDILQFKLPSAPVGWTDTESPETIEVPLRLTAGNSADVPELWVLREQAIEQLDTLVRDSDDRLTQRLKFAVATDTTGTKTVILRTIPSKLPPPALPLEKALGFKPFWKLPNLFVPVGRRLHPTLRRDAVRKMLADDADQVIWLYPNESGSFTPESVPDGAFRSLEDWVDYVIEAEQQPLAAWIEATRFDFDHFICRDAISPKTKPDKGDKDKSRDDASEGKEPKGSAIAPKGPARGRQSPSQLSSSSDFLSPPEEVKPPSEWIKRRTELEEQFKSVEGSLDAPERQALWPELASANAGAADNSKTEAAICWLNAMWTVDSIPTDWLSSWLRSELGTGKGTIKENEFERLLANPNPTPEDARTAAAAFMWLASVDPIPTRLKEQLPAVHSYLERYGDRLPVRAVWLTAYRLFSLSGRDVLGLARVRDRLLQRLLESGLTAERDLPMFLRVAGLKDSERLRIVNEKAKELHGAVRKWTEHIPQNLPYIDLLFAFALGKLGETTKARQLVEDARKVMEVPIPVARNSEESHKVIEAIVKNFLFKGFKFRVDQVLMGKPHAGQLSEEIRNELEEIHKQGSTGPTNNLYKLAYYVIARMREKSDILEPHERLEAYSDITKGSDPFRKELVDLHATRNSAKLADQIRKLYKNGMPGRILKEIQFLLLHDTLLLSTRVGESFAVELLQLVPEVLSGGSVAGSPENNDLPRKQGEILARALFLAGHFDRGDLVKKLVDEFSELIRGRPEEARFNLINAVAGQCLRSLKTLGMRDEIDRFLGKLRNEVLRGATIEELRHKYHSRPEMWGSVLQTLLNIATGWLTFGLNDQAAPILNDARKELLNAQGIKLKPEHYVPLARAYITACGQCPSDLGFARIIELFCNVDPANITNTWTTAPHYSRYHLNLVEAVIQAIVSEDFGLGPTGRKWLDDDEYLVRRRIHADMKRERQKSGL